MGHDPVPRSPRVFVSYAWEDEAHRDWVRSLAVALRRDGVHAVLDQWDMKPGQTFPGFMNAEARNADRILVIGSPAYREKVHRFEAGESFSGVGWEQMLLGVYLSRSEFRKVVLALGRGTRAEAFPDALQTHPSYDLIGGQAQSEYERLVLDLWDRRPAGPPVETSASLPPEELTAPAFTRPGEAVAGAAGPGASAFVVPSAGGDGASASPLGAVAGASWRMVFRDAPIRGPLLFDDVEDPYGDPFGEEAPTEVDAFVWYPPPRSLSNRPRFLPAAVLCTASPTDLVARFRAGAPDGELGEWLGRVPRDLRQEKRAGFFRALGGAFTRGFEVGVTFDERLFGRAAGEATDVPYQVIAAYLLLPIARLHAEVGMRSFRIWIPDDGKASGTMVRLSKQIQRSLLRGTQEVRRVRRKPGPGGPGEMGEDEVVGCMARGFAMAVRELHVRNSREWVELIQAGMERGAGPRWDPRLR